MPNKVLTGILDGFSGDVWLGNPLVVGGLLRDFAKIAVDAVLSDNEEPVEIIDKEARRLAKTLLGQGKVKGPKWFSPGQIDVWIAQQEGVKSDSPEERVAGGLLNLAGDLLQIQTRIDNEGLLREQWQPLVNEILDRYTRVFLGIPPSGPFPSVPSTAKPKSALGSK